MNCTLRFRIFHSGSCSGAAEHQEASGAAEASGVTADGVVADGVIADGVIADGVTVDKSAEEAAALVEPSLVKEETKLFVDGASRGPSVGSEANAGTKPRKKRRRKLDWQKPRCDSSKKVTAAHNGHCWESEPWQWWMLH